MSGTGRRGVIAGDDPTSAAYWKGRTEAAWEREDRLAYHVLKVRTERDAARAEVAALRERVKAVAADWDAAFDNMSDEDLGQVVGYEVVRSIRAALAEAAPDQASKRSGE